MPLQLGWAAVSAYCQHESGDAANHFGHHEHQHRAAADDANSKLPGGHADCGYCHAASVAALPSVADIPWHRLSSPVIPPAHAGWHSEHLSEPERPKWARSA